LCSLDRRRNIAPGQAFHLGHDRTRDPRPTIHRALIATDDTIVLVSGEYRSLDVRASADGVAWAHLGSVAAPERVNWGAPHLIARPDGGIDLLIRFDPVDPQESEADVWTALWEIAPLR
jgi:hypothetical protein